MHGSVWEWTLDLYHDDGYQRLAEKTHTAADAVAWPDEEYPRVLRGGSWDDTADLCRAAVKLASDDEEWKGEDPQVPLSPWWFSDDPAFTVGFRLMRPLKTLPKQEMARYWKADVLDITDVVDITLGEGHGVRGVVDEDLPAAIEKLKEDEKK